MHMIVQITPKVVTTAIEPAAHKSQSGVARVVCIVAPPKRDAVTFDARGKQKVLTRRDHSQIQRGSRRSQIVVRLTLSRQRIAREPHRRLALSVRAARSVGMLPVALLQV